MYKKVRVIVTKAFGNEDLQKILKKILKNSLMEVPIMESNDLRGDS